MSRLNFPIYLDGFQTNRTITPIESWFNGYSAVVDTKDMFLCSDCFFRIEVSVTRDSFVIIGVNLKNIVNQLSLEGVAGGTLMQTQEVDCYDIQNKLLSGQQQIPSDSTPYIIQAYSFIEHANIFITDKIVIMLLFYYYTLSFFTNIPFFFFI